MQTKKFVDTFSVLLSHRQKQRPEVTLRSPKQVTGDCSFSVDKCENRATFSALSEFRFEILK